MHFDLYISVKNNKKEFKKNYNPESCYYITEEDIVINKLENEFQEFIFLQTLEKIIVRTMKSKRFTSTYLKVDEYHKNLILETTYIFFLNDNLKITNVH